ncbi:MAG TPA: adenosylcobinamide-GDP ribazoletransferase [Macromonas sp.]|nr:adenosylcobinamide-GDP ribazoletransferase [Macromonas sp.]
MRPVRHYLLAVQFFTRIPVTGRLADWVGYSPAMLRASAAHLPGIGWLLGLLTSAPLALLLWALPAQPAAPWLAAVLSTVLGVMLTGAFHEDGLADLADGLGGSQQRERALEIMKDSRIGSFGAIALVLVLLAKCACLALLAQVDPQLAVLGLFAAHVTSRLMPQLTILTLPHVGDVAGSKSKPLADQIAWHAVLVGVVWWGLAMLAVQVVQTAWQAPGTLRPAALPVAWLTAVLGAGLAWAYMHRLLQRRLQGFTGDALGATQQLAEIGFYLGLLLALGVLARA